MVTLPFNRIIPDSEVAEVEDRIGGGLDLNEYIMQEELAGVLNFALGGLEQLHKNRYRLSGKYVPDVLAHERDEMFKESNTVGKFLSLYMKPSKEFLLTDAQKQRGLQTRGGVAGKPMRIDIVSVSALYELFKVWAQDSENIEHIKQKSAFKDSVSHFGYKAIPYGRNKQLYFMRCFCMLSEIRRDIGLNYMLEEDPTIAENIPRLSAGESFYRLEVPLDEWDGGEDDGIDFVLDDLKDTERFDDEIDGLDFLDC